MSAETVLECPRCHTHNLVRVHHKEDEFKCVNCGYAKDLADSSPSQGASSGILAALITILVLLLFLGA